MKEIVKNYSLIDELTKFLDFRYMYNYIYMYIHFQILKQKIFPPKKYPSQLSL